MNTPIQLKVNLSPELQGLLLLKASKFGLPLTQYVKHILIKDVEDEEYPTFEMSERTRKKMEEAMLHIDKSIEVPDVNEYFKSL